MTTNDVAIVAAKRTPIGSFNGSLANLQAHQLSQEVIKQLMLDTKLDFTDISEVIIGHVLTSLAGQNSARQAAVNAGLPYNVPASTVNQVCGSGLKAIGLGYQNILINSNEIVIAGGHENMSFAPHAIHLRNGYKMGKTDLKDTIISDGLTDSFSQVHMGITAENIAKKYSISRYDQDEFAIESQNKASRAQKNGKFASEIVPMKIMLKKQEIVFDNDEYIRSEVTISDLEKLKPAFIPNEGTVTAGNSSGINDGSALVILMSLKNALEKNLPVLGVIKSFAQIGVDPQMMGIGPIYASRQALRLANWKVDDLDLIESNEAFAAQALYVNRQMDWDINKVNVNGGAIALGHPIGASGARILVTLLHEMKKRQSKKGLATLCVGGGMGVAICIESI